MKKYSFLYLLLFLFLINCNNNETEKQSQYLENNLEANILDYEANPDSRKDREPLTFSDQGAWFSYGFYSESGNYGGFAGPFLMTQENGVWSSKILSQLNLIDSNTKQSIKWDSFKQTKASYNSHLYQLYENENLYISQTLFFSSSHSAIITTHIKNKSNKTVNLCADWSGNVFSESLKIKKKDNVLVLVSEKSSAPGFIRIFGDSISNIHVIDSTYRISLKGFEINPNETKQLILSHSFIFPKYDAKNEKKQLAKTAKTPFKFLQKRIIEKEEQIKRVYAKVNSIFRNPTHKSLISKTLLTLQNNWRISAGELKHSGLFPSYHYKWFNGFWAWDSWKHAAALANYDLKLAKEQIKQMYDFQDKEGMIADCIFRDTSIEKNNYRNTKPPLSAWAVWMIYKQDNDIDFIKELYPKIVKQHNWWYAKRDHDKDGICEYGSTDGTLTAAKWESGMDNAVRFDKSKILKNLDSAFSLNQESVDLNAYLYAEKIYLTNIAKELNLTEEAKLYEKDAKTLKIKIQNQFFDKETGWFYDTSIDGKSFIKVMGCEGWIPLWAKIATPQQAKAVKNNMMNPELFYTKVPFQTLSANHIDFKPDGGYWRGPNWLDQSYFGVKGLQYYGYNKEAEETIRKLVYNAEGVLTKGKSIRENYNPITGKGLESKNFSWSAAHYLLLLINE